ncbi:hypothetical protein SAMD00019534_051840 [Acytostelium subglobosum LB1]|uniref:hypothetical protein n=1 Tax=Acytostelium subglobosum LB1 TaxID=1410327 RepID=UPI000644D180|nr:hypothetical protein SAMD00019534_051840 [Acytostelium subglobosum LB1]GAM22009.1 hypothetical protein SAMD00019534_051840 [Acytostelium subglobosum LB1]|eukprot:XP_012755109.1 hypothetical protein SAMD00019534_051840 [Acytostelium subglobosum LB1]
MPASAASSTTVFKPTAVYSIGNNNQGQLGLGDCKSESTFSFLDSLSNVSVKSCKSSLLHTALLTHDHDMMTWGANLHFQIGHKGGANTSIFPSFVESLPFSVKAGAFPKDAILDLALGGWNSFALTKAPRTGASHIYTWGNNACGQMGIGSIFNIQTPSIIQSLATFNIVQIASGGFYHTHFLTDKGMVLSCGRSVDGQLGISNVIAGGGGGDADNYVAIPIRADLLSDIIVRSITCGVFHSLAIDDKGDLYQWGRGELRKESKDDVHYNPMNQFNRYDRTADMDRVSKITGIEGRVIQIAASDNLSFALTDDGVLYQWTCMDLTPIKLAHPEFNNHKIIHISTSPTHTGVILRPDDIESSSSSSSATAAALTDVNDQSNNSNSNSNNKVFIWANRSFSLDKQLHGSMFSTVTETKQLFNFPSDHQVVDLSLGAHYAVVLAEQRTTNNANTANTTITQS